MFEYLYNIYNEYIIKSILIKYFNDNEKYNDIAYFKYKLSDYENNKIIYFINKYCDEFKKSPYFYQRYLFILWKEYKDLMWKNNYDKKNIDNMIKKILKNIDISEIINKNLIYFPNRKYRKYFMKKYFKLLKIYDKISYYSHINGYFEEYKYKKLYYLNKIKNNYEFIDHDDLKCIYFSNSHLILKYKLYHQNKIKSHDIIYFILK